MDRPSRFESTRRLLRLVRYSVVAGATAAFGGLALMTRASHAGTTTGRGTSSPVAATSQSSVSDDGYGDDSSGYDAQSFGYGSSSLAPSGGGGAVVQSGGS
ncbi:MAG: hypothetical protein WAU41_09460 [Gaiellaceae bacterium]